MGLTQSREYIPPPPKKKVRRNIENMFGRNKRNPIVETSVVPSQLALSPAQDGGGCGEDDKFNYPTQNYMKYDPMKDIQRVQAGGKLSTPSPTYEPFPTSPFEDIRKYLLKNEQAGGSCEDDACGMPNKLTESPKTEMPVGDLLIKKFANVMVGGYKDEISSEEDVFDDTKEDLGYINTQDLSPTSDNMMDEINTYDVESSEKHEGAYENEYSATSNYDGGIMPFFSESSDHIFTGPYDKTQERY